jgi:alpha-glucosidase
LSASLIRYGATTFPEPQQQFQSYREDRHIRFGGIRKPRLGNTALLDEARQKGFVLPGGETAQYDAPPRNLSETPETMRALHSKSLYAEQRNLNYSIPAAREWYVSHQQHYLSDGVSFFWNDEGETDYFTFYYWNVAQRQTLAAHNSTARFYSINRAWSPGMARLGATVWTGDINPSWDDLLSTPAMILRWGLAGAPYVACDIGGFTGETNGPLLTRWMQAGAFFPTMRVHSTLNAKPHFPFLWPEPYASRMRSALNQRYRLIAFHYSLAHAMHTTGRLWMRPLAAAFPNDPVVIDLTAQWLDGELLVAPILTIETEKSPAYLPEGLWYPFDTEPNKEGTRTIPIRGPTIDVVHSDDNFTAVPVYAPAGAIVPLVPLLQYTGALPGGPLEVRVYGGADGAFQMIEDDGETTDYATATAMRGTTFSWDDKARTLSWVVSRGAPSPPSMFTQLRLVLYQATGGPVVSSNVVDIGASGSIVAP